MAKGRRGAYNVIMDVVVVRGDNYFLRKYDKSENCIMGVDGDQRFFSPFRGSSLRTRPAPPPTPSITALIYT